VQVAEHKEGAVTVLKPLGPLTAGELEELERRLTALGQNWAKRVVLDLHDAAFMDSAALELLCRHHRDFAARGLNLKLSDVGEMAGEILELTRLAGRFEIYADTAAAVRSFR